MKMKIVKENFHKDIGAILKSHSKTALQVEHGFNQSKI